MKKYLLIQPHSDDVLFGCAHVLFDQNCETEVLTVENDPKRVKEDANLYGFLGIPFSHLDTKEWEDDSYYGYYNKEKNKKMQNEVSEEFIVRYYENEFLSEIADKLVKFVSKWKSDNPGGEVISPLGIGHPFHHFIYGVLSKTDLADSYYREFPHSYKRKAKIHMEEREKECFISEEFPVEEFDDVKWELAKKFYKSQSSLLFFEQGYIKKKLNEQLWKKLPF